MPDWNAYVRWYIQALRCANCITSTAVVNANIDPARGLACDRTHSILPQAGFVETDWFAEDERLLRILILGLNPKGGRLPDWKLYEKEYEPILRSREPGLELQRRIASIQAQVWDYRTMGDFADSIRATVAKSGRRAVLAYANQILCRTIPEASELNPLDEADLYRSCFSTRIVPLLQCLEPDLVVVMGWRVNGGGWSQEYFEPFFQLAQTRGEICAGIRFVGVHQTSRPNNRQRALNRVREALRLIDRRAPTSVKPSLITAPGIRDTVQALSPQSVEHAPARGSRLGMTLADALTLAMSLVKRIQEKGRNAQITQSKTRVSIRVAGQPRQVIGIVPGTSTEISLSLVPEFFL
ncbi:MAG: hypothetical protein Kow001_17120 [Acidobacteriota bacterium]